MAIAIWVVVALGEWGKTDFFAKEIEKIHKLDYVAPTGAGFR